jgi:hypothetical protein
LKKRNDGGGDRDLEKKEKVRKKVAFYGDRIVEPKKQEEGHLAYDDGSTQDFSPDNSLLKTSARLLGFEMNIDKLEKFVFNVNENAEPHTGPRFLNFDVVDLLEMIRTESAKTDLLLLVNDVERSDLRNVPALKLFTSRDSIWIHETLNRERPRAAEFYDICWESEDEDDGD